MIYRPALMLRSGLLAVVLLGLPPGCGKGAPPAAETKPEPASSERALSSEVGAWGGGVSPRAPQLEPIELRRDANALPTGASARVAWAQGRIGGVEAARSLAALLEGDATVESAHLAALAFLEPPVDEPSADAPGPWYDLEDAVWSRLALTEAPDEAEALLFAVARIGGARSQARLAAAVAASVETDRKRDAAALEAMGMLCARQHPATAEGLEAVAGRLLLDDETARAAAYVVDRCAGPSAELLAGAVRGTLVERLTPMLASADEALSRRAWKAIAGLGEVPSSPPEAVLSATPPGWRVEVEAVRALAGHADGRAVLVERLASRSPTDFEGPRVHVLLEALRGLRDAVVGSPELRAKLSALLQAVHAERGSASARRRKALALVDCEAELLSSIGTGTLDRLLQCADGVPTLPDGYADVLAVEAILRMGAAIPREDKAKMLLERAADPRPRVASAALASLVDVDDARIPGVLASALARADVGVQAAAATAIATRSSDRARRDESVVAALERAVKTWPNATAIEGRIAAVMALGNLARSRGRDKDGVQSAPWLEATVLPLATDAAVSIRRAAREALAHIPSLRTRFDQATAVRQAAPFGPAVVERLGSFEGVTGLRLTTSAGAMTMRFEGAAPYNQATVASLAAEGFYDGLTMHRVVPGFVIQGGDPRGDGYGGPGFLVPCERSNQKYERGVVGMALAGKDTGGSQFFVAHEREPRLDGRYTILGRITEGLDVLDRVLPHDQILRVEVLRGG